MRTPLLDWWWPGAPSCRAPCPPRWWWTPAAPPPSSYRASSSELTPPQTRTFTSTPRPRRYLRTAKVSAWLHTTGSIQDVMRTSLCLGWIATQTTGNVSETSTGSLRMSHHPTGLFYMKKKENYPGTKMENSGCFNLNVVVILIFKTQWNCFGWWGCAGCYALWAGEQQAHSSLSNKRIFKNCLLSSPSHLCLIYFQKQ